MNKKNQNQSLKKLDYDFFQKLSIWYGVSIISKKQGKYLIDLIQKNKPKNILDLGTGVGYSLSCLLKSINKNVNITSIEYSYYLSNLCRIILKNYIKSGIISIECSEAFKYLIQTNNKFDFIFFDTIPEDYAKYLIVLRENKLLKNAILIARLKKGSGYKMSNYLQFVQNPRNFKTKFKDFGKELFIISKYL